MVPYNFRRASESAFKLLVVALFWPLQRIHLDVMTTLRVSLAISVDPFGLYVYAARHPRLGTTW
jgi:hypothetical protein